MFVEYNDQINIRAGYLHRFLLLITLARRLWSIALSHMSQQYGVYLAPLLTLIPLFRVSVRAVCYG